MGTYTEDAKIAIQKMLGIYEAPWELIREDTFTNAEVATHSITTDANGEAFQLTDVLLMFETPKQTTSASRTNYGATTFYKGTEAHITYNGAYTQEANGAARGTWTLIEKKGSLVFISHKNSITSTNYSALNQSYQEHFAGSTQGILNDDGFYIDKINIGNVQGTGHYKLYGKRKWR